VCVCVVYVCMRACVCMCVLSRDNQIYNNYLPLVVTHVLMGISLICLNSMIFDHAGQTK